MMTSISSMRIDSFEREKAVQRKLDIRKIMLKLMDSNNYFEFLRKNHQELLLLMNVDALVIYKGQDGGKLIYGATDISPTEEGLYTLIKSSKDSTLLTLSDFSDGLEGDGAGVAFYKNQYVTIAIIRRNLVSDIHWAGPPDGNIWIYDIYIYIKYACMYLYIFVCM